MARVRVTSSSAGGPRQLGHPVPAVTPLVVEQRPAGVGDGYQSGPPVSGVVDPGHQTPPFQPLNQFGRRIPRRPTPRRATYRSVLPD